MTRFVCLLAVVACGSSSSDTPVPAVETLAPPAPVQAPAPMKPTSQVAPDREAPKPMPKPTATVVPSKKPRPDTMAVETALIADLLTGESSPSRGDSSKRRPGATLGSLADVRDSGAGLRGGDSIGATGSTGSSGGPSRPSGSTGRISTSSTSGGDDATLTPETVMAKIQAAYMAGLKRCYVLALRADPTAKGAVVLHFTVNESGRATDGTSTGFSTDVDGCIAGQMAGWRFPIPKDKDGAPTSASFTIRLNLVPE